jgi:glucose uptake protein GlcU
MANAPSPEGGTLLTAALLILALGFVGYYIYTKAGDEPVVLAPWFLAAAVGLVVLAIVFNVVRARTGTDRR